MGLISDPPGHPGYGGDAMSINGVRYVTREDYDALKARCEALTELLRATKHHALATAAEIMNWRTQRDAWLSSADGGGS